MTVTAEMLGIELTDLAEWHGLYDQQAGGQAAQNCRELLPAFREAASAIVAILNRGYVTREEFNLSADAVAFLAEAQTVVI